MAKILDTKSSRGAESDAATPAPSLIPAEKLVAIYTAMVKCRMLQKRAADLFQQGKLDGDLYTTLGREACAAAVGIDLDPEDTLSIAPGDWLPAFTKGLPAEMIFRALAPRVDGSISVLNEEQKHNILESHVDQATTVRTRAESVRRAEKPAIVVALFERDAAWQKVISSAGAMKLPIVFVQHAVNGRPSKAVSSPNRSKTPQSVFHGVPGIAVDAADPVALYRVAYEAITRARQGRGATLLECATIPTIQAEDPTANHPGPDPVANMEAYLKNKGIGPEPSNRQLVDEFTRDLDLATRFLAL